MTGIRRVSGSTSSGGAPAGPVDIVSAAAGNALEELPDGAYLDSELELCTPFSGESGPIANPGDPNKTALWTPTALGEYTFELSAVNPGGANDSGHLRISTGANLDDVANFTAQADRVTGANSPRTYTFEVTSLEEHTIRFGTGGGSAFDNLIARTIDCPAGSFIFPDLSTPVPVALTEYTDPLPTSGPIVPTGAPAYGSTTLTADASIDMSAAAIGDRFRLNVVPDGNELALPTGTRVLRGELLDGFNNHIELEKVGTAAYLARIYSLPIGPVLVYRQDVTGGTNLVSTLAAANSTPAADPETASLFSILDQVEGLRRADGKLEFELIYPAAGIGQGPVQDYVFHWEQTSNPFLNSTNNAGPDAVTGFAWIGPVVDGTFNGLSDNNGAGLTSAFYNGNSGTTNWWTPIGLRALFGGIGFPVANISGGVVGRIAELRVLNTGA